MADSGTKTALATRRQGARALAPTHPDYDAAHARDLARRTRRIRDMRLKGDELYWQQGLELMVIRDRRLYLQAGYRSFSDWILRGLGRSRPWAYDRISVASAYTITHVRTYGLDLLEAAARYVQLTSSEGDDAGWNPDTLVLRVPMGERVEEIPFRKAGAAELEAARAHQVKLLAAREQAAIPEQVRKGAEQVRGALQVPQSERVLADVRVRAPESGLAEDTRLSLHLRYGDLRSVVTQLAKAVLGSADPVRGRP
jgi:hypothetical protein